MTATPPPGWHADPHAPGRLRWWDGTRWTEHTHSAGEVAFGLDPRAAGQRRPAWRTWPVLTVAVLVLVGSCTAALGTISPDEASLETTRSPSQPAVSGTTSTGSPTATRPRSAPPASSMPAPAPTTTARPPSPSARPPAARPTTPTTRPPTAPPRPPSAPERPPAPETPPPGGDEASSCSIKGNIARDGERIYHVPGQQYYDKTKIDESKGERWFCSESEAVAAGWRKAKV
ncbi:MAG: DUF2510 domain-containing protein [Phycicoccus sp.]